VNSTEPLPEAIVCCEAAPASQHPLQPAFFVIVLPLTATFTGLIHTTFCGPVPPPPPFETVTDTGADVVVLPAASEAVAVNVYVPFATVVVSQLIAYGAVVSAAPRFAPFSLNCTAVTPTLSLAVALTVTVPDTVAPLAGAVTDTVGGVVSPPPPPPPVPVVITAFWTAEPMKSSVASTSIGYVGASVLVYISVPFM
jgi:hypothetical protein